MPPAIKTQKNKFKPGKNFYLSLLDNSAEAIIVIDETGHLIYQNLAAKTISGHELKDIEGMHVFDFIHPEDQEEAKAFFREPGTEAGGQKKKEFRLRHQDKLYRWVEGTFTNMRHHEDIKGFIVSCRDITDKRQIEEDADALVKELQLSFAETSDYKYALDASSVITIVDVNGKIKYVNDNFCTLTQFTREDVIGRNPRIFNSGYHSKEFFKELWETVLAGKVWKGEIRNRKRNGEFYWGNTTIVPFLKSDGKPYQFLVIRNDVTEKKNAEQKLEAVNLELKSLFNKVQDVLFSRDVTKNEIIQISPSCEKVYGYSPEDFYNNSNIWQEVIHPEDKDVINKRFSNFVRGLEVHDEYRIIHKDGSVRWLRSSAVPTLNENKVLVRIDGVITDITERKNAETAHRKSEANLRSIVDNTDTSYLILDKDFKIVTYNALAKKLASELLKIDFEEGADYFELAPEEHRSSYKKMFLPAMAGGKSDEEICWGIESESPYWFHVRIHGIKDQSGTFYGLFIAVTNITTRKKAEQKVAENEKKISSLFENMQEGIANCEMIYEGDKPVDFIYHNVNDRFEALTGLKNVTGKRVTEAIPGITNTDQEIFNTYDRVIKTGRSIKTEYFVKAMNMWFSLSIYHIEGNYFAVVFDVIDERKKAEAEILALNESLERKVLERTAELEQTNKDLEAFSYTVSHDLQAPLRAVRGFSDILREQYSAKLDDAGKEYLTFVSDGAARMSQLITELLAFSRFGKAPLAKQEVNMSNIVAVIVEEAKASDPDLKTEIKTGELPSAVCDPGLIKQVWANLIYNAVKYSKKKPLPVVEIGSDIVDGKAIYFVKDNGAGFDMKNAARLFNVFKRLHSDSEFEGTGVGLALAHKIVTRHGGVVWAEAKVNEGATFYFTLPGA